MSCSADDIAQVRRMVSESGTTTYSDSLLAEIIEKYPKIDADGYLPTDDDWTDTYDLNAAAAQVWGEKAAALTMNFDFSADGASFSRSQEFQMATRMAVFYRSRRNVRGLRMISSPKETDTESLDDDTTND